MEKMRFKLLLTALLAAVLLLPSCRSVTEKAIEKARRDISIEGIEKVEPYALKGIDLTLRVRNDSKYRLLLRNASLSLWFDGVRVGDVVLREGVEVERRTTGNVITRWRFQIEDPLALFAIARRVESGDLSQIGVSYSVDGRGGPMPVNISNGPMPLSDFLRIFGLTIDDIKSYMGK